MKTRRVNVALVLPFNEEKQAVWSSEVIASSYPAHFELDVHRGPFAHVTLYSFERKEFEDAPGGETKLRKEVMKLRPFGGGISCKVSGVTSRRGYIMVGLDKPEELMEFQARVVRALRDFAKPVECTEAEAREHQFTKGHIENLLRYGFSGVDKEYNPHITLSRLVSAENASAATELVEESWKDAPPFRLPILALFRSGEHGTCTEAVDLLDLSDNNF